MISRKSNFEVVRLADIDDLTERSPRGRILSFTHDPSLARTREMLFTGAGFEVATFLDVDEAIAACKTSAFDLIVVGHSIPLAQRKAFVRELRTSCATPVLAMLRQGEARLPEADYFFDPLESPALLLQTIIDILRPQGPQD
jgi:DNA-binding NtrC family response regulator